MQRPQCDASLAKQHSATAGLPSCMMRERLLPSWPTNLSPVGDAGRRVEAGRLVGERQLQLPLGIKAQRLCLAVLVAMLQRVSAELVLRAALGGAGGSGPARVWLRLQTDRHTARQFWHCYTCTQ